MSKLSISIISTLFLLSVTPSIVAAESSRYAIFRGSTEISTKDPTIQAKIDYPKLESNSDKESACNVLKHEFNILNNQLYNILHTNPPTRGDLWRAIRNALNTSIPIYRLVEIGTGKHFQLIFPFAREWKVLAESQNSQWTFLLSGTLKTFLELGSHTKVYGKLGKCLTLNPNCRSTSILPKSSEVQKDIIKTLLETPLGELWKQSETFLGMGVVRKTSSNMEFDFSVEGYTTRESERFHFTASAGINYRY